MTTATNGDKQVDLWPYVLEFALYYFIASVILEAVSHFVEHVRNVALGISLIILYYSENGAVVKFVHAHRRPFTRGEQFRFSLLAFVATIVVGIVILAVAMFLGVGPDFKELSVAPPEKIVFLAIAMVVFLIVWFAIIYFLAGWRSRKLSKMLAEKGTV